MRKLIHNIGIKSSFWALLPIFALSFSATAADLCRLQRDFFAQQLHKRISVEALAQDIAASQASIILIGESHFENQGATYANLLAALREHNSDLDCVTFEANHVTIGKKDYALLSWRQLRDQAKKLGLRVYNVDRCLNPNGPNDFVCLRGRNEFMTARLKTAFTTGACHKILHVGGAGHYQNVVAGEGPNMAERLLAEGYKPYRLQIVDTLMAERHVLSGMSVWNWADAKTKKLICPKRVRPVNKSFAFLNRGVSLANKIPVFYANEFRSGQPWSDFDAALVLGKK